MYTKHFRFNAKPFQICTDPRFLWLGEQHKEALAILQYGIRENKGVIALAGGVGTGKTTLINSLMHRIKDDVIAAVVSDPGLKPIEFFHYVTYLYGIKKKVTSKVEFLIHFETFLKDAHQQKKRVLLVIDEAQRLNADLLEEIRLLSNFELSGQRLLNVFLVGQNELNAMLLKPENRNLKQRIATYYNIVPLTLENVHTYVGYRLKVAGCRQEIFTGGAISEVFAFSKGYPRLINAICDQSLIEAYVRDKQTVTAEMVINAAKDFRIPDKSPSQSSTCGEVVYTTAIETVQLPPVRSTDQHQHKWIRSAVDHLKNTFYGFRSAYIGSALAILIVSGYLIYQYTMGSPPASVDNRHSPYSQAEAVQIPMQINVNKIENTAPTPQRKTAPYSAIQKKPTAGQFATEPLSKAKGSNQQTSAPKGHVAMQAESPPVERSATTKEKGKPLPPEPSENRTSPGNMVPGHSGPYVIPEPDSAPAVSSEEKDPGAIIDWLIQKKNTQPEE